jgi:hypothetical protein
VTERQCAVLREAIEVAIALAVEKIVAFRAHDFFVEPDMGKKEITVWIQI